MFFNSFEFLVFVTLVFGAYWMLNKHRGYQNVLILLASYVFYGWWDYRFLGLLFFSTFLDFFSGLKIHQSSSNYQRKVWLIASVAINLGFLGFFKYYNFFVDSFTTLLEQSGIHWDTWTLSIILPVGISFYTFHGLSYVFDVYNKKIEPTRNFVDYAVFVSFFPLLVAGPIERATHLLPQIKKERVFQYNQAIDGLRQILWGLFKKVVIADRCAEHVNAIFASPGQYDGGVLVLGAVLFAIQIYGDFSGYSDIALGTARLFGFELLRNFAFPYFSRDIAEFWRRWHISLSSWFRDYLYFPLGGSRKGFWLTLRNTAIIFLVSGFWHGANWTFIVWGALHAIYFIPLLVLNKNRSNLDSVAAGKILPSIREFFQMACTFLLVSFAWIFFRAESVSAAWDYSTSMVSGLFDLSGWTALLVFVQSKVGGALVVMLFFFWVVEWIGREKLHPLQILDRISWSTVRWSAYYLIIILIFLFAGKGEQFIYFQF